MFFNNIIFIPTLKKLIFTVLSPFKIQERRKAHRAHLKIFTKFSQQKLELRPARNLVR